MSTDFECAQGACALVSETDMSAINRRRCLAVCIPLDASSGMPEKTTGTMDASTSQRRRRSAAEHGVDTIKERK
jgi:hypothetical protein